MKLWPNNLQKLITHFGRLPGIGPKMAERIVLYLITTPPTEIKELAKILETLHDTNIYCSQCHTLSQNKICDICQDDKRDKKLLLIVADPVSAFNIETSEKYSGQYFVLGGLLNPIEGITPEKLRFKELLKKIKNTPDICEVILAFNANVEGEATTIYFKKLLSTYNNIKLSRLARGLPMGSDLTYADEITLSAALTERQDLTKI